MSPLYKAIMVYYLGSLVFTPNVGSAENTQKIEEAYSGIDDLFPIDEEKNTIRVQDWLIVNNKRMEIIQADERKRFEPVMTIEMEIPVGNIPYDRLKAKQGAYCTGLELVMMGHKREGEAPIISDGFSVDFVISNGKTPEH